MKKQKEGKNTEPQTEGEGKDTPPQKSQRREFHSPSTSANEVEQITEKTTLPNQPTEKEKHKLKEKEGQLEKRKEEEGQATTQAQQIPPKKKQRTIYDYAGIRSYGGSADSQPSNEGLQSETEGMGQDKGQKPWWREQQTEPPSENNREKAQQGKMHHPIDKEEDPKQ